MIIFKKIARGRHSITKVAMHTNPGVGLEAATKSFNFIICL